MSDQSGRLFPESMEAAFKRLPWRLGGGAIIAASLAGYVSLLTWSIHDPSLNHATGAPATNLLGRPGAILADLLMQSVGLAAAALLLPPVIWGWNLAQGTVLKQRTTRFIYWAVAATLFASALGALAVPKAWALSHGLGGVLGDVFSRPFFWLGGPSTALCWPDRRGVASALGFGRWDATSYRIVAVRGFSRSRNRAAASAIICRGEAAACGFTARLTQRCAWSCGSGCAGGDRTARILMTDGAVSSAHQVSARIAHGGGSPEEDELDDDGSTEFRLRGSTAFGRSSRARRVPLRAMPLPPARRRPTVPRARRRAATPVPGRARVRPPAAPRRRAAFPAPTTISCCPR
jgi:hypothetical protein